MSKIDILLATYNGAEYIATQVRSLQSQTFADWCLLVHDDGSTDNTLEILEQFAKMITAYESLTMANAFTIAP